MKLKSSYHNAIMVTVALSILLVIIGFVSPGAAQEKKRTVQKSELPDVIKKAIEKALPNGKILTIEQEIEGEDPGQYDVEMLSGGKKYEVEISKEGKIKEVKEVEDATDAVKAPASKQGKKWTDSFGQENCKFATIGGNRFFILKPGYELVLENSKEKVVITVLNETKKIGDIETRILEEREYEDGKLKEVSRNNARDDSARGEALPGDRSECHGSG